MTTLIRSKTRVPAIADAVIERGRVVAALTAAAADRNILQVVASAGSGKTTAVVQYVASRPGPRAWLTLGEADGSPGRFVTYLAAAVGEIVPGAEARVRQLLAGGSAHADCAALLAEDLPAGATLVIDDVHLVEDRPPVLAVLRALLDAVAPDALVVLVSRRLVHLDLSRSVLVGRSGTVSGRDLAFTTEEAGELLAARGVPASAEDVVAASGGWAAGIVFDALRGARPAPGEPPPDDPFFAYLGAEVLDALPADLRRDVVRSALLHTVDPRGLEALLGVPSGEALLTALRRHHLPATLEPEGLRYHPRFREFLLSRLREDPDQLRMLLIRHARNLAGTGHLEEAADHFIAAGALAEAVDAVVGAATPVLLRGDWEKVLAWCADLGEDLLSSHPTLRGCELRALLAGRRNELPTFVDALRRSGEYDRLVAGDPDAATTAAFGLHLSMDWGDLLDLLPPDDASPGVRALRYVLEVGSGQDPPRPWHAREVRRLTPNVGLFQCGLYFQGRLDEVDHLASVTTGREIVGGADFELYRIAALRVRGLLGDARAAHTAALSQLSTFAFHDFWTHVDAELTFAEGDHERGLALVRQARLLARRGGHQPADQAIFAAAEGEMLVRMGRVDEAVDLLGATRAWCAERGLPCFGEWASTWLAAALLRRGDPPAAAVALLEDAIAGMVRAERILELPVAWVLLAEARWRLGDEAGHDAAADAAYAASQAMGGSGPLLTALEEAPDVLVRRIDAGGPEQAAWRALARAGGPAHGPSTLTGARIVVGTLGRARLEIDGREVDVSPPRAIDLAAAVARAGARGVSRASLVSALAAHSSDPANYLRQMIHRLRRLTPEGIALTSEDGMLRWSPPGAVLTEDQVLGALLARADRATGDARLEALGAALAMADRGTLAVAEETTAAVALRAALEASVAGARRDQAELLIEAGRAAEAVAVARAAVTADPYREDGWRLLMRAGAQDQGPSAAVPVYLECVRALAEVDLEPARETRVLMERLRDPGARVVTAGG
ncbi:BTAD domain-containing putative transcriptional regulator [Miltoncostaea oceani]|uniref:BTAD domain-containing putative transcriptional regulator n=1 Tax=Miltoncostaea oceani TaxID=2843216 RepID=UPI001C3CC0E8|nr:BTAD domain-containing putative transcriptional regulator [Miltoncostaea oceani]